MNVLLAVSEMKTVILVGSVAGAFLQAAYSVSFFASVVRQKRPTKQIDWAIRIASALLFTMVTLHWLLGTVQLKQALIDNGSTEFGPALYYLNINNPINLSRVSLYVACCTVIDLLLTYRMFILFERNLWVVAPSLVCLGVFIGCFITAIVHYASVTWFADALPQGPVGRIVLLAYALTLVTSFYPSALIIYQIVRKHMDRAQTSSTRSVFWPVIHTVVESALFYSVLNCAVLGLYLRQSSYIYLLLNINPQLIGINFSLIFLRIRILSAQRTERISRTALPYHASYTSFSARSHTFKPGVAQDPTSLQVSGSEQQQQQQQLSPGYRSASSFTLTPSRDSLKPEATYGVPNSLLFAESAQGSAAGSPSMSDILLPTSLTKTTMSGIKSPTKAYTPPTEPRW